MPPDNPGGFPPHNNPGAEVLTIGAPGDSSGSELPFGDVVPVYQQVYNSAGFPSGIDITQIAFTRVYTACSALPNTIRTANYALYLSRTRKLVDGLDTSNLAANRGSDRHLFASLLLSGNPGNNLTIQGANYRYKPSEGNLLLEIQQTASHQVHGGGGGIFFDSRNGTAAGLFSRAMSVGAGYAGYGLVTVFSGSSIFGGLP